MAKPSTSTRRTERSSLLVQDTAPTLMTGPIDTHISSSVIKRIQNQTLMNSSAEQLQNLADVFPDQITPTLHPPSSPRHRTIQPHMKQQTPSVTNLPLHSANTENENNLHNSLK